IAVGIDLGVEAHAEALSAGESTLTIQVALPPSPRSSPGAAPDPLIVRASDDRDVGRAFAALLAASGASEAPVAVHAHATIAPGGGLGCSAALGIAIARALDPGASLEAHEERAMTWEQVFHGNPSGI